MNVRWNARMVALVACGVLAAGGMLVACGPVPSGPEKDPDTSRKAATPQDQQTKAGGGTAEIPPRAEAPPPAEVRPPAEPPQQPAGTPTTAPVVPPVAEGLSSEEQRDIDVFRRASSAVVYIENKVLQRQMFSMNATEVTRGSGTGFVWDKEGHIVTNFHVIEGDANTRFTVRLADRSEWDAEVVGTAPEKDLAVLKIGAPGDKLVPLTVGRSGNLLVGQRVLAVGNPFGLDHTLTVGVVSALGRELASPAGRKIKDMIQTDAAINPGNSGGPLLDSSGRLVGVNSAIYSPSGAFAGVGFAIPVDTVKRLIPQLITKGKSIVPGIGIIWWSEAPRYGIKGVVVQAVDPRGPAAKAGIEGMRRSRRGLELGDVIVAVDGKKIDTIDDLADAFETAGVGGTVTLTVVRDEEKRTVKVPLIDVRE